MPLTLVQFEYAWEIHVYLRFAGIYYTETNCSYTKNIAGGNLPYLIDERFIIPGKDAIDYLKKNYTDLDLDYSDTERAEIALYSYLLNTVASSLYVTVISYCDPLKQIVQTIYRPILGLPSSLMFAASNYLQQRTHFNKLKSVTQETEEELLSKLEALYGILNQRLASQKQPDFLFGYRPSTADVYFFAHLAQIQEVPSTLQHIVSEYPYLQDYYQRIMNAYFIPLETDTEAILTTNVFLLNRGLKVEVSNEKRCFITRKYPYATLEEKEENEETIYQKQEEERYKKNQTRNIVLFTALVLFCVGAYGVAQLLEPDEPDYSQMSFCLVCSLDQFKMNISSL
ncbi:hypothetical protein WA171_004829 [Blastocystis sp. BT1]